MARSSSRRKSGDIHRVAQAGSESREGSIEPVVEIVADTEIPANAAAVAGDENDGELWCICNGPALDTMVGCEECNNWFHLQCVGETEESVSNIEKYYCPNCLKVKAEAPESETSKRPSKRAKLSAEAQEESAVQDSEKKEEDPPASSQTMCKACGKNPARPGGKYCSSKCLLADSEKMYQMFASFPSDSTSSESNGVSAVDGSAASTGATRVSEKGPLRMNVASKNSRKPPVSRQTSSSSAKPLPTVAKLSQSHRQSTPPISVESNQQHQHQHENPHSTESSALKKDSHDHATAPHPVNTQHLHQQGSTSAALMSPDVGAPYASWRATEPLTIEGVLSAAAEEERASKDSVRIGARKRLAELFRNFVASKQRSYSQQEEKKIDHQAHGEVTPAASASSSSLATTTITETISTTTGEAAASAVIEKAAAEQQNNPPQISLDALGKFKDPEQLAVLVEAELFRHLAEKMASSGQYVCGTAYKTKYRSLVFNLKDAQNEGLVARLCRGEILPFDFVRFSSEELANADLANLIHETRKRAMMDVIVEENIKYIKKTHKGEVELDIGVDTNSNIGGGAASIGNPSSTVPMDRRPSSTASNVAGSGSSGVDNEVPGQGVAGSVPLTASVEGLDRTPAESPPRYAELGYEYVAADDAVVAAASAALASSYPEDTSPRAASTATTHVLSATEILARSQQRPPSPVYDDLEQQEEGAEKEKGSNRKVSGLVSMRMGMGMDAGANGANADADADAVDMDMDIDISIDMRGGAGEAIHPAGHADSMVFNQQGSIFEANQPIGFPDTMVDSSMLAGMAGGLGKQGLLQQEAMEIDDDTPYDPEVGIPMELILGSSSSSSSSTDSGRRRSTTSTRSNSGGNFLPPTRQSMAAAALFNSRSSNSPAAVSSPSSSSPSAVGRLAHPHRGHHHHHHHNYHRDQYLGDPQRQNTEGLPPQYSWQGTITIEKESIHAPVYGISVAQSPALVSAAGQVGSDMLAASRTWSWGEILPSTLRLGGRITVDKAMEYLSVVHYTSKSREISVVRFDVRPASRPSGSPIQGQAAESRSVDDNLLPYVTLFEYLHARSRIGVISNCGKGVKDFYLMPVSREKGVPAFLKEDNFLGIDESLARDTIYGIAVLTRDRDQEGTPSSASGHHPTSSTQPSRKK